MSNFLLLQILKFQFNYQHIRLARHRSNNKPIIVFLNTNCWTMARWHIDRCYMDCWVEHISHRLHIIADIARQVQVRSFSSFPGAFIWKLVNWPLTDLASCVPFPLIKWLMTTFFLGNSLLPRIGNVKLGLLSTIEFTQQKNCLLALPGQDLNIA